jgi:hypothetical protein
MQALEAPRRPHSDFSCGSRRKTSGFAAPADKLHKAQYRLAKTQYRLGKRSTDLIWEEVSHSYTEAAAEGDVVVGKRKSPKGEYVKRTPTPMRATVVVTREEPRSRNKLLPANLS